MPRLSILPMLLAASLLAAPSAFAQQDDDDNPLNLTPPGIPALPPVAPPSRPAARPPLRQAPLPVPAPRRDGAASDDTMPALPPVAVPPAARAPRPPAAQAARPAPPKQDELLTAPVQEPLPPLRAAEREPVMPKDVYARPPKEAAPGRPVAPKVFATGRAAYIADVRSLAQQNDVPADLVDAVIAIETGYDPHAVSDEGAIGLMQVRPAIARDLAFGGSVQDLFEPTANLRIGITYLAGAWKLSGGKTCDALNRYRSGWTEMRISEPMRDYCRRALVYLASVGSPVGADIDMPGLAEIRAEFKRASRFDWDGHDARVKAIERRFGGENFGILAP